MGVAISGLEIFLQEHAERYRGARLGLCCNPTAIDRGYRHAADRIEAAGLDLRRLFGPEHGPDGKFAGEVSSSHEIQILQLQQQVLALMQDISKGRAALKQESMVSQNERLRAANLDVLLQRLRDDVAPGRQPEELKPSFFV